jgi:hypothetical protein
MSSSSSPTQQSSLSEATDCYPSVDPSFQLDQNYVRRIPVPDIFNKLLQVFGFSPREISKWICENPEAFQILIGNRVNPQDPSRVKMLQLLLAATLWKSREMCQENDIYDPVFDTILKFIFKMRINKVERTEDIPELFRFIIPVLEIFISGSPCQSLKEKLFAMDLKQVILDPVNIPSHVRILINPDIVSSGLIVTNEKYRITQQMIDAVLLELRAEEFSLQYHLCMKIDVSLIEQYISLSLTDASVSFNAELKFEFFCFLLGGACPEKTLKYLHLAYGTETDKMSLMKLTLEKFALSARCHEIPEDNDIWEAHRKTIKCFEGMTLKEISRVLERASHWYDPECKELQEKYDTDKMQKDISAAFNSSGMPILIVVLIVRFVTGSEYMGV